MVITAGLVPKKIFFCTKCTRDNIKIVFLPKLYKMGRRRESLPECFFAQEHLNPVLIRTKTSSVKGKESTMVFYFMIIFNLQSLQIITRRKIKQKLFFFFYKSYLQILNNIVLNKRIHYTFTSHPPRSVLWNVVKILLILTKYLVL